MDLCAIISSATRVDRGSFSKKNPPPPRAASDPQMAILGTIWGVLHFLSKMANLGGGFLGRMANLGGGDGKKRPIWYGKFPPVNTVHWFTGEHSPGGCTLSQ